MPGEDAASEARFPRRSQFSMRSIGQGIHQCLVVKISQVVHNLEWREIRTYFTTCWPVGERPAASAQAPELPSGVRWGCLSLLEKPPPSMDVTGGAGVSVDGCLGRLGFEAVRLIAVKDSVA